MTGHRILLIVLAASLAAPAIGGFFSKLFSDRKPKIEVVRVYTIENESSEESKGNARVIKLSHDDMENLTEDKFAEILGLASCGHIGQSSYKNSPSSSGSSSRARTGTNTPSTSPSRKSPAASVNTPSTDTSIEGGNGKIFFPFKPKESETDKVNALCRNQGIPKGNSIMTYISCTPLAFVTVNGKVHQYGTEWFNDVEEKEAGYKEGACEKVELKLFFKNTGKGNICYVQTEQKRREYNILKDTYKDIHTINTKRCTFNSEILRFDNTGSLLPGGDGRITKTEARKAISANTDDWKSFEEKEPEHIQDIVLVVYDCKTPSIPLSGTDKKIWELDGNTLKLKMDGTEEHLRNLRNAGCRALGSFAMTMYKDFPTAHSTAIMYNCPENVDGYEKREGGKYVQKWREDWASDNCYPTMTKTQLDKDGNLQSITAKNFQDDDMDLTIAPSKRVSHVGKAILRKAETFLDLFPKVKVGNYVNGPSYVRHYFDD